MIYKSFTFLVIIISALAISSCSRPPEKNKIPIVIDTVIYKPGTKELFTGTWNSEMDSMKIVFDVVNGKKEGKFKTFYPNGKPLMSGQLKNNRNVGEWKYFYNNGNLESTGIFENDKPAGLWSWYYPDGTLRQTGFYKNGTRDSIWKTYDQNGTILDSVVIGQDTTKHSTPF